MRPLGRRVFWTLCDSVWVVCCGSWCSRRTWSSTSRTSSVERWSRPPLRPQAATSPFCSHARVRSQAAVSDSDAAAAAAAVGDDDDDDGDESCWPMLRASSGTKWRRSNCCWRPWAAAVAAVAVVVVDTFEGAVGDSLCSPVSPRLTDCCCCCCCCCCCSTCSSERQSTSRWSRQGCSACDGVAPSRWAVDADAACDPMPLAWSRERPSSTRSCWCGWFQ